jgi:hypothetical protein
MAKWFAVILIIIHIHHSVVMILGEFLQMQVVAAAKAAGVPFFEEHGINTDSADNSDGNEEALSLEPTDFSFHTHFPKIGRLSMTGSPHLFAEWSEPALHHWVHEILTPPPQG